MESVCIHHLDGTKLFINGKYVVWAQHCPHLGHGGVGQTFIQTLDGCRHDFTDNEATMFNAMFGSEGE